LLYGHESGPVCGSPSLYLVGKLCFANNPNGYGSHQLAHLEASDEHAVLPKHTGDSAASRRTTAFGKQLIDLGSQGQPISVDSVAPLAILVVTGATDIKRFTDHLNRLLLTQIAYQRVRFISSDI